MNKKQSEQDFKQSSLQFLNTDDGSITLLNSELNETYHSLRGAMQESEHVYIKNGLQRILDAKNTINILEVGFGTGLNTLLTLEHLPENCRINYFAIEPFPLSQKLLHRYYQDFKILPTSYKYLDLLLNASDSNLNSILPGFNFTLIQTKLKSLFKHTLFKMMQNQTIDLVYYDAFAPSRQADMWDNESLGMVYQLMGNKAILSTYCAQGEFKRTLKKLGFDIENPPGAHGKREMTVATKPSYINTIPEFII